MQLNRAQRVVPEDHVGRTSVDLAPKRALKAMRGLAVRIDAPNVDEHVFILLVELASGHQPRVHHHHAVLRKLQIRRERLDQVPLLLAQLAAELTMAATEPPGGPTLHRGCPKPAKLELVIADDRASAQLAHDPKHPVRVRAACDQVADEHHAIFGTDRNQVQQVPELDRAPVDVANDEGPSHFSKPNAS